MGQDEILEILDHNWIKAKELAIKLNKSTGSIQCNLKKLRKQRGMIDYRQLDGLHRLTYEYRKIKEN